MEPPPSRPAAEDNVVSFLTEPLRWTGVQAGYPRPSVREERMVHGYEAVSPPRCTELWELGDPQQFGSRPSWGLQTQALASFRQRKCPEPQRRFAAYVGKQRTVGRSPLHLRAWMVAIPVSDRNWRTKRHAAVCSSFIHARPQVVGFDELAELCQSPCAGTFLSGSRLRVDEIELYHIAMVSGTPGTSSPWQCRKYPDLKAEGTSGLSRAVLVHGVRQVTGGSGSHNTSVASSNAAR